MAAVRAVVLAAVQPLAVVAALEEVRQALALRAAMLAPVGSWRRRTQLQHQPLAVHRLCVPLGHSSWASILVED